jgi:predicted esterase
MRKAPLALMLAALAAGIPPALAEDEARPAESAPLPVNAWPPLDETPGPLQGPWCAPELMALPGEACAYVPAQEASGPRTLIIYLHGVIQPDSGRQWIQERRAARVGARHGVAVLIPRGRRGLGPKPIREWWGWPTTMEAQRVHEARMVAEWEAARAELESRTKKPFERVLVFAFSSGAYFATSLLMRGRLGVDGYALFSGGSGAEHHAQAGARTKRRPKVFVAWGAGDPQHGDQEALAEVLGKLRWPSKSMGSARAGHAMTDAQVDEAMKFLSAKGELVRTDERRADVGAPAR